MKYYFCLSVLFLSLPFILNCKGNTPNDNLSGKEDKASEAVSRDRELVYIDALYYNYVFDSNIPVKPEDVKKNIPRFATGRKGVLDVEISDANKIEKVQKMLANLQASAEQSPVDARIVINLHYNDGSQSQLCIGGIHTNKIYLDGTEQKRDNNLLFTLKNYIGFYPWLIGDDMFKMSELRDNSFPKGPFISNKYYKEYQQALNER